MNKLYLFILLLMFSSNSMATDRASECATLNDRARLNCYDAFFQEPMETGTPAPKQFESMATPTPPSTRFTAKTNTNTAIALIKVHAITE
ncbi:MAG: hypothetical protein CM15mP120_24390 [Pseudomonadota bacterium]|nr:MAG: hypothetical protein CM15mP120_24390 [Pseudomonadota bacterium]